MYNIGNVRTDKAKMLLVTTLLALQGFTTLVAGLPVNGNGGGSNGDDVSVD
jgi:pectate lyase